MATDSVMGLFATPEQLQQQRNEAALTRGIQLAQLSPVQAGAAMTYAAGNRLGGAIGGALGGQDPQLQAATAVQQLAGQFDLSTSAGNLGLANALREKGLLGPAAQLANKAATMRKDEATAMPEKQRLAASLADTKAQRGTPEWMASYQESLAEVINPEKLSTNEKDFRAAQKGGYKGSFNDWVMQKQREGATRLSVDNKQETAFASGLGTAQAKGIMDSRAAAEDAASILETNEVGRQLLSSGAITGTGANFFVGLNSALKQAGVDFGYGDAAANTQAYAAAMGSNVGKLIKQFGAGTGLSDADRKYATQIAAGDVTIDEKAMRRILDINDRASRNTIAKHNKRVEGIKTNVPLTVEIPTVTAPKPAPPAAQIPTTGGATGNPLIDKYLVKPQGR